MQRAVMNKILNTVRTPSMGSKVPRARNQTKRENQEGPNAKKEDDCLQPATPHHAIISHSPSMVPPSSPPLAPPHGTPAPFEAASGEVRGPNDGLGRGALSLGAPRGRAGRGTGQAGSSAAAGKAGRPPVGPSAWQRADTAIRGTDNDAMGSRLSAILQHYLPSDPFTPMLASSEASTSATLSRRSPIINIGTYLRCRAIDSLVATFLAKDGNNAKKQVISLGAGSDSRFWRLHADVQASQALQHYLELDFAELTAAKIDRIVRHKELFSDVGTGDEHGQLDISPDRTSLQTGRYSLISCDLRTLTDDQEVRKKLERYLDPNIDTLIIAECVLAYLSPDASNALLAYFGSLLSKPCAICYEMCVAGDVSDAEADPSRFGYVMLSNLEGRNLSMPGSRAYATTTAHARRFEKAFRGRASHPHGRGTARTLKQAWIDLEEPEKQRLSRLEGLDEVEELEILLAHYAISWYAYDARKYANFLDAML